MAIRTAAARAKAKKLAAPVKGPVKRVSPAMRQRALELAVTVSGVSYSYTGGGALGSAYGLGTEVRRKNYETDETILATAAKFLSFLGA